MLKSNWPKWALSGSIILTLFGMTGNIMCAEETWKTKLQADVPALGHRNWIVVADSAYPAQTGGGIEVVATGEDHFKVLESVLVALQESVHVRPNIYMDAELQFVTDQDAKGASKFREKAASILKGQKINSLPHMDLIMKLDAAARNFRVLVLKTNLAIPYTTVFLELDCKYWSAEAENRLREAMKKAGTTKP